MAGVSGRALLTVVAAAGERLLSRCPGVSSRVLAAFWGIGEYA